MWNVLDGWHRDRETLKIAKYPNELKCVWFEGEAELLAAVWDLTVCGACSYNQMGQQPTAETVISCANIQTHNDII